MPEDAGRSLCLQQIKRHAGIAVFGQWLRATSLI